MPNTTWGSFSKRKEENGCQASDQPISSFWCTQIGLAFGGPTLPWHTCYCTPKRPFAVGLSVLGRAILLGWDLSEAGWFDVRELLLIELLSRITSARILN